MAITVSGASPFERPRLAAAAQARYVFNFLSAALTLATTTRAEGSTTVAIFVNDAAAAPVLEKLWTLGVRYPLVRAAGPGNVALPAARRLGLRVATVPHYSLSPLPGAPWPRCWAPTATGAKPTPRCAGPSGNERRRNKLASKIKTWFVGGKE